MAQNSSKRAQKAWHQAYSGGGVIIMKRRLGDSIRDGKNGDGAIGNEAGNIKRRRENGVKRSNLAWQRQRRKAAKAKRGVASYLSHNAILANQKRR